jgi:hypothetical protein
MTKEVATLVICRSFTLKAEIGYPYLYIKQRDGEVAQRPTIHTDHLQKMQSKAADTVQSWCYASLGGWDTAVI